MPASVQILKSKSPDSTIIVDFEFLSDLALTEELTSGEVVTVEVYSGTDLTPSALLDGTADILGTKVRQSITGGTVGNVYTLICSVDTSLGSTLIKSAKLAIVAD